MASAKKDFICWPVLSQELTAFGFLQAFSIGTESMDSDTDFSDNDDMRLKREDKTVETRS